MILNYFFFISLYIFVFLKIQSSILVNSYKTDETHSHEIFNFSENLFIIKVAY